MSPSSSAFAFEQLVEPVAISPAALAGAAADAERLVHEARAEADRIRAEAQREGFEAGYAAGADEVRGAVEPGARALAETLGAAAAVRDGALDALEREAVDLAFAIAEKVLAGALEAEPERVLDAVRGGLRCLADRDRVEILVNPDDVALVRGALEELAGIVGGLERVEVREERRVGRGGAILETVTGEVDARVETKLARARDIVASELGR